MKKPKTSTKKPSTHEALFQQIQSKEFQTLTDSEQVKIQREFDSEAAKKLVGR